MYKTNGYVAIHRQRECVCMIVCLNEAMNWVFGGNAMQKGIESATGMK